jgi:endo-1,4-beta-xylanase
MKILTTKSVTGSLLLVLFLNILPSVSLAQMANGKPKFVGNIIGSYVPASFDTYWNQVTPGNSGKWGSVEVTRDVMIWTDLDKAYNHAAQKNYPFKQHTLVWGMQQPAWIDALSPSEQAAEVEEWISLYAQRYPNTQMIDVVNEPLHVVPTYANAIGGAGATGWDWVIWSFQKARQYCPNAKLLLNDYGILGSAKATTDYIKIINLLKARGLIDGIGVQAHGLEYAQTSTIQKNLTTLQGTGIPVYVSELDLEHADDATQLGMYQRVFPLLYEHPAVTAVTLWGYLAGEHWKPNAYLLGRPQTLGTFTVGTAFQDYTVSGTGKVQVHLTNDNTNNSRDLEVDYVIINGVTYQAEDMALNTGVWTGTCGGSFSPFLHCDGYIEFPRASGTITVRARGTLGSEVMDIRVIDDTFERPALQWLRYEYFGTGGGNTGSGVIAEAESGIRNGTTVSSVRSGYSGTGYVTGFDAAGDYVEVNVNLAAAGSYPLIIRYASDASMARSIRLNGSVVKKNLSFPASATFTDIQFNTNFLAGNNTIRIYVERGGASGGDIDYIKIGGASAASLAFIENSTTQPDNFRFYPNPSHDGTVVVDAQSVARREDAQVEVLSLQGELLYKKTLDPNSDLSVDTGLKKGVYLIRFFTKGKLVSQSKFLVQP